MAGKIIPVGEFAWSESPLKALVKMVINKEEESKK